MSYVIVGDRSNDIVSSVWHVVSMDILVSLHDVIWRFQKAIPHDQNYFHGSSSHTIITLTYYSDQLSVYKTRNCARSWGKKKTK